jgi:hypothetical protein
MRYTLITLNKKRLRFSIPWLIFFGSIFIGCNRCKLSPYVDSDEQLIFSPTLTNISNTNPINIPNTNPINIPDTNPTNIPDTNPTNIPDTNNSTDIPNTNPTNIPDTNNTSTPPMENQDITSEMINRIRDRAARGGPVGLRNLAKVLRELKGGDKTHLNTTDPVHSNAGTALHSAAYIGDLEIVKVLLKAGANINAKDKHIGTPLCDAARGSQIDVAAYLLSQGADKTITSEDKYSNNPTPYEIAEEYYKINPTNERKRLVDMLKP